MGKNIGKNAVRIAVKNEITNDRMISIIEKSLVKAGQINV